MVMHEYGDKSNKAVILLHGLLVPYQIWDDVADKYSKDYFVVVPELDAHTEEETTEFISISDEAKQIYNYVKDNLNGEIYLLAGISMGGRIAATVANMPGIKIDNLVLDGAPLMKMGSLIKFVMKSNYKSLIKASRKRSPKVKKSFERDFLPAKYWEPYLKLADRMSPESINNCIDTVFMPFDFKAYPESMRILFMHGTKGNEVVSKKSAIKMKEFNPQTQIRCFDGLPHCHLISFKQDKWMKEVEEFLK